MPPTVEYTLVSRGKTLIPALESLYLWAQTQMSGE
ncbi:winged helix-turn-helix transcriptional regulator [Campylobacter sp. VBCF_07 NA4]